MSTLKELTELKKNLTVQMKEVEDNIRQLKRLKEEERLMSYEQEIIREYGVVIAKKILYMGGSGIIGNCFDCGYGVCEECDKEMNKEIRLHREGKKAKETIEYLDYLKKQEVVYDDIIDVDSLVDSVEEIYNSKTLYTIESLLYTREREIQDRQKNIQPEKTTDYNFMTQPQKDMQDRESLYKKYNAELPSDMIDIIKSMDKKLVDILLDVVKEQTSHVIKSNKVEKRRLWEEVIIRDYGIKIATEILDIEEQVVQQAKCLKCKNNSICKECTKLLERTEYLHEAGKKHQHKKSKELDK